MTEAWADPASSTGNRHLRQQMLPAWSQEILRDAKVLVAGCGTLGNEVLKNLALTGIGTTGLLDHDAVEEPNLGTSVLFRDQDIGRPKAIVAAERLAELAPGTTTRVLAMDLTTNLGEGVIADYDLVLGCLDGIHARWKLNRLCHRAGVPWIDAGIENFGGQIASFDGQDGPCYECGMTASMWERLNQRRRCALPAGRVSGRPVATSIALASLVASLQIHEAVAVLHRNAASQHGDRWTTLASGDRVLASLIPYQLAVVHGRRSPLCMAHPAEQTALMTMHHAHQDLSLEGIFAQTSTQRLEVDWDIVSGFQCDRCGTGDACIPDFQLADSDLVCSTCGGARQPLWTHTVEVTDALAKRTPTALGVPDLGWLTLVTEQERSIICRLTVGSAVRG